MNGELGAVSQAILDYVNQSGGFIVLYKMVHQIGRETGASHTETWYFRRLIALALEGRIEARVHRAWDDVAIRFRRLQEAEDR